jgi:hypothetical protein
MCVHLAWGTCLPCFSSHHEGHKGHQVSEHNAVDAFLMERRPGSPPRRGVHREPPSNLAYVQALISEQPFSAFSVTSAVRCNIRVVHSLCPSCPWWFTQALQETVNKYRMRHIVMSVDGPIYVPSLPVIGITPRDLGGPPEVDVTPINQENTNFVIDDFGIGNQSRKFPLNEASNRPEAHSASCSSLASILLMSQVR